MDIQKIQQYKSAFDLIAKSIKDDEGNTIKDGTPVNSKKCWGMRGGRISSIPDGRISWWPLAAQWNRVRRWEAMWMIIFVRSRK